MFLSALILLFHHNSLFYLGFRTEIGQDIIENWRVVELLTESNYKTNKEEL